MSSSRYNESRIQLGRRRLRKIKVNKFHEISTRISFNVVNLSFSKNNKINYVLEKPRNKLLKTYINVSVLLYSLIIKFHVEMIVIPL